MLDQTQQRVVGVLIEKELSVPETYPLTENSLLAGCNQAPPAADPSVITSRSAAWEAALNAGDVDALVACGARVRLCKGAYAEPADLAFQERSEVSGSFERLMRKLLEDGNYAGIATHDERLVWESLRLIRQHSLRPHQYEFQMLLGGVTAGHGEMAVHAVNVPVSVAGMDVAPGELIHMDENGAVKFPADRAEAVLGNATAVLAEEAELFSRLRRATTAAEVRAASAGRA